MSQPQPVLGYPSKSAAAWALKQQGLKQYEIGRAIGVKESSVGNLVRVGRQQAGDVGGTVYTDALKKAQRTRLRSEAKKRGVSVRQLVAALLGVIADDRLFAALLDVEGEEP